MPRHVESSINETHEEWCYMKRILLLATFAAATQGAFAQPTKPTYSYFEGMNFSMGFAQNSTRIIDSSVTTKGNTALGVAKINYTFALAYPAKLGISASFDTKNSKTTNNEYLATSSPTEITVEPGFLLISNSLLYSKLGTYASKYEGGTGIPRTLSGRSYGVGIKHYVYGQNFIQAEWTERSANETAGLPGVKFKQSSAAVYVGFNF